MPLDPNILLGVKSIEQPDPLALARQGLSLADLSSQFQTRQYLLKNAERKDQAAQVLGQVLPELVKGNWSEDTVRQLFANNPALQQHPEAATELLTQVEARRKAELDAQKSRAAAAKDSVEARAKALENIANTALGESQKPDNLSLSRVNSLAEFHGFKLPAFSGDQNDIAHVTAYLRAVGNSAYAAKDQIANVETRRHNVETEGMQRQNYASEDERRRAETRIGEGNLDVNRQRLAAEGKVIETDEDGNTFIVDKATGTSRQVYTGGAPPQAGAPAPGASAPQPGASQFGMSDRSLGLGSGPGTQVNFNRPMTAQEQAAFAADPGATGAPGAPVPPGTPLVKGTKLTESQGVATAFAKRMRQARSVVDELEATGEVDPTGQLVAHAGSSGPVGAPVNWAVGKMNPYAQVYEQAKRNWVTANLRKESGAAIPPPEMQADVEKWFPIIGDSPEAVDAKRRARETAEEAMITQAGPGKSKVPNVEKIPMPDTLAEGTKVVSNATGRTLIVRNRRYEIFKGK